MGKVLDYTALSKKGSSNSSHTISFTFEIILNGTYAFPYPPSSG